MEEKGWGEPVFLEPAVEFVELICEGEVVRRLRGPWFVVGDGLEASPDGGGVPLSELLTEKRCFASFTALANLYLASLNQTTSPLRLASSFPLLS